MNSTTLTLADATVAALVQINSGTPALPRRSYSTMHEAIEQVKERKPLAEVKSGLELALVEMDEQGKAGRAA